jgi:opacity protein-like surface antigen
MKKAQLFTVIILVVGFMTLASSAQAQVFFGVKPSAVVQSSYFGFGAGTSMVIEFGLDYARIDVKVEGDVEDYTEIDQEGGASMMMPHGGIKLYLKPRTAGMTSPYFLVDVFKAFTSVDLGDDEESTEDAEEFAQDLLSPFGLNLAFGAEYHFSDHFSLGGEYGFRYLMSKAEMDEADLEVSASLGMTYAAITANFAF